MTKEILSVVVVFFGVAGLGVAFGAGATYGAMKVLRRHKAHLFGMQGCTINIITPEGPDS